MKLTLGPGESLTLDEGETLTVYELDAAAALPDSAPPDGTTEGYWREPPAPVGVFGAGTLITCCEILTGYIAPTVNLVCALPFYAQAVSVFRIDVHLPSAFSEGGAFDIRRRRADDGTGSPGEWAVVAEGVRASVWHDDFSEEGGLRPNVVYEYQWRLAAEEDDPALGGWSRSDPAWLTQTFDRTITIGGVWGIETAPWETAADEFAPDAVVPVESAAWIADAAEEFVEHHDEAAPVPNDAAGPFVFVFLDLTEGGDMAFHAGQTPVFYARITNTETGNPITPIEIESASYTVTQVSSAFGRGAVGQPVEHHTNAEIPLTAFLEGPIAVPPWSVDEIGYNFKFTPDTRQYPAFENPGEYAVTFKVVPTVGNPIVWKRALRFT